MTDHEALRPGRRLTVLAALLLTTSAPQAHESREADVTHWAVAPFFGTGAYRISPEQSVFAFSYTPRWAVRESSDEWREDRDIGLEFLLPMALGLNRFEIDEIEGIVDLDNVSSLSVVPGVYLTLPMSARWTLLGVANLGAGIRLDGQESALTYRAGLRSRYRFGNPDGFRWSLLSSLEYIGYRTDTERSAGVFPLSVGVELEHRLDRLEIGDRPVDLVTHLTATDYLGELRFDLVGQLEGLYAGDVEIGFALRPEGGFRILGFEFERIGLAFRQGVEADGSDDAGFRAIRVYFRSVFDQ